MYLVEYISKTFKFDEEVLAAIGELPESLNQYLRRSLVEVEPGLVVSQGVRKRAKKDRVADALAASDLTAQAVGGRPDVQYGHHEELPSGQHVANVSPRQPKVSGYLGKPSERK